MIFIAHRGNFSGPDKATENSVQSIDAALLKGFDVEIDVWKKMMETYILAMTILNTSVV